MDFHSLTRKELQTLCKKNKIPANLTNVAMADALASLHHVEGLEEILEESKFESQQLSEEAVTGTPNVPRTTCRTSARRKPISKEPESSQILTRTRLTTRRGGVVEEADQESIEVVPKTPAAPSSRRRAPPVSARQKTEAQKEESSVQRAYSTRRSVRLLEKTMEELSLVDNRKIQPSKIDELSKEETAADSSLTMSGNNMQTTLEVCSEKTEDFEVSSVLKSDGSTEIRPDMNNDVQEKRENHVTELELSMLKPESTESVEKFDENVNVLVETFGDNEIDSVDKETQNQHSEDSKAEQHLGTEDSLAAEISNDVSTAVIAQDASDDVSTAAIIPDVAQDVSDDVSTDGIAQDASDDVSTDVTAQDVAQDASDDVSTDVITQDVAPKSSFRLEEYKVSTVNESSEQIPLNLSSSCVEAENFENFSSEATAMSEEENVDESSEEESADTTALDDNSSKLLGHISEDKIESEEKETPLADGNAVESEIVVVEDSYQGKRDLESESVTEEEIGDDISDEESVESEASDEESVESEASDDESVESDASDEDFTDSESVDDDNTESDETDLEASLVDVDVTEREVSAKTPFQSIPCHVDDSSKQGSGSYGALVDVCVVAAEEFITVTSEQLPSKSPPSLKETSPAHHMVSGSNVTSESPLPTFSADQLSGQFPRPTLPTPSKSSSNSHPVIQMIADVMDEQEENHVVPEKYENPTDDKCSSMPKLYGDASLRQLQKMLRERLQIENEKKVGKTRIALQTLPENRMTADEAQKEN